MNAQTVLDNFHYLFQEELDELRRIVLDLPPNPLVINIGSGSGTSGLLFLETREDTVVVTIDITNESSPLGCLTGERDVVEQAGLSHLWGVRWFQLHGDSKKIGQDIDYGFGALVLARYAIKNPAISYDVDILRPIDLLFIDGDHTYEGCKGDLDVWLPYLKAGGIVAIHDYQKESDWRQENPSVIVTDEVRGYHIKPYTGVDQAVDDTFWGNLDYERMQLVRSLVVYQKRG